MSRIITRATKNRKLRFECTSLGSHKFYELRFVKLKRPPAGREYFQIDGTWGPIGGSSKSQNKYTGTSFSRAQAIWNKLIAEKETKGYVLLTGEEDTLKGTSLKDRLKAGRDKNKDKEDLEKIRKELEEDRFGDLEI